MKIDITEELLDKFYDEYHAGNFKEAILILEDIIKIEGKATFWVYSRLSSCYYELRDYKLALFYAKKAYKLNADSPLVLWDYAGALIMLQKERQAIELLKRIQNMSDDLTKHGFKYPDIKWMKSIKNDANFLIGKAYYTICEDVLAKKFLVEHLSHRAKGKKSIYSKRLVLKYLKKLEKELAI